jgi:hypothetical protein
MMDMINTADGSTDAIADDRRGPARYETLANLRHFVNDARIGHEVLVISLSYVFILSGAWNDGLLGLAITPFSRWFEICMALALVAEIASRLLLSNRKGTRFWSIALLDATAVMTVIPALTFIAFARLGRAFYASGRLAVLLDRIACRTRNASYLMILLPFIVPLMAAVVYAIEKRTPHSSIHNYFQALSVCLGFTVSLGNIRPSSPWSMAICGTLFLIGIICIGIVTNAIYSRYQQR